MLLILRITFLYVSSGYQNRIFHSKYVILIVLCLVSTKILFSTILLGGLRVNYSVNIETIFHIILVVIYMTIDVKTLKKCMYFWVPNISCTKFTSLYINCTTNRFLPVVRKTILDIMLPVRRTN